MQRRRLSQPDPAHSLGAPGDAQPAEGSGFDVRLLGGFRIRWGGHVVDATTLRLRHARHLLALLALAPGHRLAREEVMEALWPEADPDAARNRFHYALHAARHALAPGASARQTGLLPLRGGILHLAIGDLAATPISTDVAEFEAAAATARAGRNVSAYEAAIACYAGDLLPEERYEDWTAPARERLRGMYLSLLIDLARLQEARGDLLAASDVLGQLLAHDPAHEDAHLSLMRILALQGLRHEALRQYGRMREVLRRDVDVEPSPAAQRLYRDLLAGHYPPSPPADDASAMATADPHPVHTLPVPLTSFIGRQTECTTLRQFLTSPTEPRLVTLTGPGGCGKTRLAIEIARQISDLAAYPDGVYFVDLAALSDPSLVAVSAARATGVREEPGRPIASTLAAALRTRSLLLVLDNCEHLVDACAELVTNLLGICPHLRVLATSRAPLRIPGEQAWRIPSLSIPEPRLATGGDATLAALESSDAARLFAARARLARADFAITVANAPAVVEICRRLDGLPLALELAAARVATLSVEQIATRLDDALAILTAGSRAVPARQQTLRATLDWSYALLPDDERTLLRRLAAFAGGWTLEAAEAIGADDDLAVQEILSVLAQLVDKSLVQVEQNGEEVRYRLLEPVRQYAAERLASQHLSVDGRTGEAEAVGERHAAYYLAIAKAAPSQLRGPQQVAVLARLEREHDNLRSALRWALAREDAETVLGLTAGLWPFWWLHGHLADGCRWLDAGLALGKGTPSKERASTLMGAAVFAQELGDTDRALALHESCVALQRQLGDQAGLAFALNNLAMVLRDDVGDYKRARQLQEESLALLRELGVKEYLPRTLDGLGLIALLQGDHPAARTFLDESLALSKETGDTLGMANTLRHLGLLAVDEGDPLRAETLLAEDAVLLRELGHTALAAECCEALAEVAHARGRSDTAARLLGTADTLRGEVGQHAPHQWRTRRERTAAAVMQVLGAVAFAAALAAGRGLTFESALSEVLAPDRPEK